MASSRKAVFLTALVVLGLIAAGGYAWFGRRGPKNEGAEAAAKARQFRATREAEIQVDLKNSAVADLENGQFAQADPVLLNLATAGMREPLGRNWTIERLLAIQGLDVKRDPSAYDEAVERAQTALNLETALESKTAVRHYLAAKLAEARNSSKVRVFEQHIAAGTSPGDAVQWGQLYHAQTKSGTAADLADSQGTLKSLHSLVPDNLYVQLEWLGVQASKKDQEIADTLSRLDGLLSPIFADQGAEAAARFRRLVDEAQAAVKGANWPAAGENVAAIEQMVRPLPEVASDRQRIQRDLSWHIVSDYTHAFYQKHRIERRLPAAGKPVQFRETPLSGPLTEIADAHEAQFVEVYADPGRRLGIAVLRDESFVLFRRDAKDSKGQVWFQTASVPLPRGAYSHFLSVDLGGNTNGVTNSWPNDFVLFGPAGLLVLETRVGAGVGPNVLTLHAVPAPALAEATKGATSVVAIDLDGDGLNDLVVACRMPEGPGATLRVLRNQGNRNFRNATARSWIKDVPVGTGSLVAVDWDNDLDTDLLAPGLAPKDGAPAQLAFLKGRGLARFGPQRFPVKDSDIQSAKTLAVLDADSNGSWDLLASGPHGIQLLLTSTIEHGRVDAIGVEAVSDFPADGLLAFDYDNDGCPDLIAWNRDAVRCFHGSPEGHFEPTSDLLPAGFGAILSADFGDLDQDGDSDLLVVKSEPGKTVGRVAVLTNEGGNANNWIDVRLENHPAESKAADRKTADTKTAGPTRVPPKGRGATLCLKNRGVSQMQMVTKPVTHFGLGSLDAAQVLRVLWNTGVPVNVPQPAKNTTIVQTPPSRTP
jgi:FG-GAP-like repeat